MLNTSWLNYNYSGSRILDWKPFKEIRRDIAVFKLCVEFIVEEGQDVFHFQHPTILFNPLQKFNKKPINISFFFPNYFTIPFLAYRKQVFIGIFRSRCRQLLRCLSPYSRFHDYQNISVINSLIWPFHLEIFNNVRTG